MCIYVYIQVMQKRNHSYTQSEKLVSIGEAAEILGVARNTLRRWEDAGDLTAKRTVGGHRRYSLADLQHLVSEKSGDHTPEPHALADTEAAS